MRIPVLRDYEPDTEVVEARVHTMVGLPAPAHLPGPRVGDRYRQRYPPKIDDPVILEIVPTEGR
jgi:hypothetical protein